MRTVSFSSPKVREMVENDFVAHVVNTEGDPSAGASIGHAPEDKPGFCTTGIARQNVQTLFLTPDGEIFHTASGFHGPDDLLKELNMAKNLFAEMQDDPENARTIVQITHAKLLDEVQAGKRSKKLSPAQAFQRTLGRTGRRGLPNGMTAMDLTPSALVDKVFGGKGVTAEFGDYKFMANNPLMPYDEFEKDPRQLVGNAQTAFASGSPSGSPIGANSFGR